MSVLDVLLEGFDSSEARDPMGRWMRGATSALHGAFKIGDRVTYESGSRGAGGHGPVTFTRQPGVHEVVGFQRNGNLRLREPKFGTTVDVHHTHATKVTRLHPEYRGAMVQQDYARDREKIAREKAARATERQLETQARMASSSRERALAQVELERRRGARMARPRVRESASSGALGALLEGER